MRPWYPFYPSDYQRDTKFLTPMADLVYRRLLDQYWMNRGPLPYSYAGLARAIGLDTRVVKKHIEGELSVYWQVLEIDEGTVTPIATYIATPIAAQQLSRRCTAQHVCLFNQRMQIEIEKCEEKQAHLSNAGRKGGLAKAKANAIANEQARPQPQPEKEQKKTIQKKKSNGVFKPPTVQEVADYITEKGYGFDAEAFVNFYAATNWVRGKTKIKNWKACCTTWHRNRDNKSADDFSNYNTGNFV